MFTGIITDLGRVRAIRAAGDTIFEIETKLDLSDLARGASVACSGACLSVIEKGPNWFAVQVSAETRARTTLEDWREGSPINLERPLRLGEELGGHIVLGHVDGVAKIVARRSEGESIRLVIEAPRLLDHSIAAKGSVTLDGVSLTVNEVEGQRFGVNVIPRSEERRVGKEC